MKKYRIYTVIVVFVISMCLSVRQNSFLVYANEQSEVVGELIGKDGKIYFIYPDGTLAMDWFRLATIGFSLALMMVRWR